MKKVPAYFDLWLRMGGPHFRFGTFFNTLQIPAIGTDFSWKNDRYRRKTRAMRPWGGNARFLKYRILRGQKDLLFTPLITRIASLALLITEYTSSDNCWFFHLLLGVHGSPNDQIGDIEESACLFRSLTSSRAWPLSISNFFQCSSDSCHRSGFFLKKRLKSKKNRGHEAMRGICPVPKISNF